MAYRNTPSGWNEETDILVIGSGTAGLRAAIAVRDSGADVLVLEKMDSCYECAGAKFAGQISFAGTDEQKAEGIKDSVEAYTKDVMEGGYYGSDPKIVKAFMDRQLDIYHWLKDLGVKFGYLALMPRNTIKRTLAVDPIEMITAMQQAAETKGARFLFNTPAKRLISSPGGEILGVKAESNGRTLYFRGKRATILATGGFGRSPEWMEKCQRGYSKLGTISAPGCTGDGLLMALEFGAEIKGLPWFQPSIGLHPKGTSMSDWAIPVVCGAILVNKDGKRFTNEEEEFHAMGNAILEQPDEIGFQILDEKIREISTRPGTFIISPTADALLQQLKADTVEGLAEKAGINPENLRETIDNYNSYVKSGKDPEFGRTKLTETEGQLLEIDMPPFYAFPTIALTAGTSIAGLVKDEKCRAINVFGEVIPRLYVSGEIAIGFHGYRVGTSGSSIVMAISDGLIAAENAVKERAF